ncbi:MAG: hypothetical protein E6R07_15010 [Nevskiaceae bacterium]|nr:MAG: hypothetical protein E6R07_15010 [Nevskiaceae bacterium]
MTFTVEQEPRPKGTWEYRYRIYKDGCLVAHYWHDHRGDEHGIEFIGGEKEPWPVGRMTEFLEGGGPQPLSLSSGAVAYLTRKCS